MNDSERKPNAKGTTDVRHPTAPTRNTRFSRKYWYRYDNIQRDTELSSRHSARSIFLRWHKKDKRPQTLSYLFRSSSSETLKLIQQLTPKKNPTHNMTSQQIEEELLEAFTALFLREEQVEGLDEDLVTHISGMLSSKVAEDEGEDLDILLEEVLEELLNPFLESLQCPEHLQAKAQSLVETILLKHLSSSSSTDTSQPTSHKLKQGIVSMSTDLDNAAEHENDANRFLWGTEGGIKAMANDLIDAHNDKTSAKEKRKVRKGEAEQARKLLSSHRDEDVDGSSDGLVRMNYRKVSANAAADKARDVQVRNVTLSLDNGTVLLESGDLKFAYQRRYGLIGENGVGKVRFWSELRLRSFEFDAHSWLNNDSVHTFKSDCTRGRCGRVSQALARVTCSTRGSCSYGERADGSSSCSG